MTITITIPDALSQQLMSQANARHISVDELAVDLLAEALHQAEAQSAQERLVKLVEEIRTTSSSRTKVNKARVSLLDLLMLPMEPVEDEEQPLSPEAWNSDWANIEAEEKALARANDISEGRR